MRSRPPPSGSGSVTTPMTVARTSHLAQIRATSGQDSGVTMASIRSWLSLVITSQGSMPSSRRGTALDVDVHAHPAAPGRLAGGAGQPGAAQVLDPHHELGVEQLEAGLDEALLLEGVAHLDAGPLGVVGRRLLAAEAGRGQHADPADAVAAGARTEEHGQVARTRCDAEHETLGRQRAHAEHVDQRVLGVAGVERQLAPDRGHADRVPVARDAADDALDQPTLPGVVGRPEEERVHDGQGSRPHGEDVAQDAADPGGRALVGLDGGRMVVALDPDGHRDAVAGVDHARVLPGADQDPVALGGQAAQVQAGGLVGAVLAPHHRVEGELEMVGRPPEDLGHRVELVVGEAERPVQGLLVGGGRRIRLLGRGGHDPLKTTGPAAPPRPPRPLRPRLPGPGTGVDDRGLGRTRPETAHRASRRTQAQCRTKTDSARVRTLMANSTTPLVPLAPDAMFEVVEHVHTEQIDPRSTPRQQPEQGRPPRRQEAEGGGEQAEGEPAVGQGEGPLELRVGHGGLRGDQRAVGVPGHPVGQDQERRGEEHGGHGAALPRPDRHRGGPAHPGHATGARQWGIGENPEWRQSNLDICWDRGREFAG